MVMSKYAWTPIIEKWSCQQRQDHFAMSFLNWYTYRYPDMHIYISMAQTGERRQIWLNHRQPMGSTLSFCGDNISMILVRNVSQSVDCAIFALGDSLARHCQTVCSICSEICFVFSIQSISVASKMRIQSLYLSLPRLPPHTRFSASAKLKPTPFNLSRFS